MNLYNTINITNNEIVYIPIKDPEFNNPLHINYEIIMTIDECDEIITKHLTQNHFNNNQNNINYYQKMNFIKILSSQFIKFYQNIYYNNTDGIDQIIQNARERTIKPNFINQNIYLFAF